MLKLVAALVVVLGGCGQLTHWTPTDIALESAFVATLAIDGKQTTTITANCQEYNPVIGPCGERMPPALYEVTTALLHLAISAVLPSRARTVWQGITVGVEAHNVYYNSIVPDQERPIAR